MGEEGGAGSRGWGQGVHSGYGGGNSKILLGSFCAGGGGQARQQKGVSGGEGQWEGQ